MAKTSVTRQLWVLFMVAAVTMLAGCGGTIQTSDGGIINFTVVPGPGGGGGLGGPGFGPGAPSNSPPLQPGNGGTGTPDPTLPPTGGTNPPPVATGPAAPTNSAPPANGGNKQQIEQQYNVSIQGPDSDNQDYLNTIAFALARYPQGSMNSLKINIQIESFDQTGGVGGVWWMDGNQPTLTVYQASNDYRHIIIHELAHNFDIYDHPSSQTDGGAVTASLIGSVSQGNNIPDQDVPSPYANYGLQSGKDAEYGAEVISWSLDSLAVPGFSTYSSWQPDANVKGTLTKYLDPGKLVI